MRQLHEIAIFQTVKPKVIISLFETVRLSVSISLRNLYNSLNIIKEMLISMNLEIETIFWKCILNSRLLSWFLALMDNPLRQFHFNETLPVPRFGINTIRIHHKNSKYWYR